jgi:hypothetical protein
MSPDTVKTLAERRVRRQKIFIAIGSVLLLAILGYELPKLLGGKSDKNAVPGVTVVSPGVVGAPPPVPAGKLPPTDRVVVVRDSGQLISFGLFKSKDPFVQQLSTVEEPTAVPAPPPPTTTSTTPTSTPPASTPGQQPGVGVTPVVTTPSSTPGTSGAPAAPGTTTPTPPPPAPTSALISTNGECDRVSVNGTFPMSENIFRLVSIAKNGQSVQIAIVGGSYDSGQPTATLKMGQKMTLVNTADGTRYVIELMAKCSVVNDPSAQGTSPTSTTPVSPTPPPSTTTTTTETTTTPIVTDGLDTTTPTP